jgi:hypothetical protein
MALIEYLKDQMKQPDGIRQTRPQDNTSRVYTREFKAEAVSLAEKHKKPVRQVAADLGLTEKVPVTLAFPKICDITFSNY